MSSSSTAVFYTLGIACSLYAAAPAYCVTPKPPPHSYAVLVNKANNELKLFDHGVLVKSYPVATGKYKCTPEGHFRIIQKSYLSTSGCGPLGSRWMGLNTMGRRHLLRVGIHGTNDPNSIGHWASKACVRMRNSDVDALYDLLPMNCPVTIVNQPQTPVTKPATATTRQSPVPIQHGG